ncbi:hypothetical protein CCMA1212_006400 [Trichoderma ghanense]|uniref:Uncharacterized protein n=1 Tax=Trichoderma ghanense TaxID=65468 RepID=A0ABY2GZQ2_9HYPO
MTFMVLNVINFCMNIKSPSEETKALMDDFLSESIDLMWRPKESGMKRRILLCLLWDGGSLNY